MHAALMLNMTLLGIVDIIFDAPAFTAWLAIKVFIIIINYFLRRFILHKETNLDKKLHTYFTKSIYTYNGDATHNIHAGSQRTTSYRSV